MATRLSDQDVRAHIRWYRDRAASHTSLIARKEYDATADLFEELLELRKEVAGLREMVVVFADAGVDWNRWHDLLDIRDGRGLSSEEQVEYDALVKVVEVLDAKEAEVAGRVAGGESERKNQ